ncbi:MAG: DNA-binding protein [Novosphingobium sp.]|nr:DNA-binding protein [Novosphingobium sp.]
MKVLLKELDAAEYLSVKPETLTRWRWSGNGPRFYKVGGAVRYKAEDLDAFLIDPRAAS